MPADLFVDTNVLVYAHDVDAGEKHERAKRLITELWQLKPLPWLSVQVLQELLVTLRRKGVATVEARETVEAYMRWRIAENSLDLLNAGIAEMERWQLSLWDGLILAAARSMGATTVYSEDLSDEQDYGGIRVVNPFRQC
ncbi:MAG: PIN domain-containing protein [Lentisphaerae bacterium]|nr:PIN domain-containing protein [Lentisphaerota bacterium]